MQNSDTPKVSLLVPICNVERYLRECLDSAVAQTLKDIEIICINDDRQGQQRLRRLDEPRPGDGARRVRGHP